MSADPKTNGGLVLRDLCLPHFRDYAAKVEQPVGATAEDTRVLGGFLRDVIEMSAAARNFRTFGPDETASSRLSAVFEASSSMW